MVAGIRLEVQIAITLGRHEFRPGSEGLRNNCWRGQSRQAIELSEDLATGICQHVAANVPTPMAVDEHGLPGDLVALKAGEAKAEAENSGKPPEIAAKIAEGKIRKFFEEVTLVGQKYVRDDSKQIGSLLPKGTSLKNFVRLQVGGE